MIVALWIVVVLIGIALLYLANTFADYLKRSEPHDSSAARAWTALHSARRRLEMSRLRHRIRGDALLLRRQLNRELDDYDRRGGGDD